MSGQRGSRRLEELRKLDREAREIRRRMAVLLWMREKKILDFRDVARAIMRFYLNPSKLYEEALRELKARGVEVAGVEVRAVAPLIAVKARSTAQESRLVSTSTAPSLSSEELELLATLGRLGGELDSEALMEVSGVSSDAYWRLVHKLARRGLIVATLTYSNGKPHLGFKLTREGRRVLDSLKPAG